MAFFKPASLDGTKTESTRVWARLVIHPEDESFMMAGNVQ